MGEQSPVISPLCYSPARAIALLAAIFIMPSALLSGGNPRNAGSQFAIVPEQLALRMSEMINRDRSATASFEETKGRSRPLVWDERLAAVARAHSEDMASSGFFSHEGSDGSLPDARVSRQGIEWRSVGENIAESRDIEQAEDAFMNEPKFRQNHRANILNPNYTRVGIGIVKGPDGTLYITQDFAQLW